jgi:lysozyme
MKINQATIDLVKKWEGFKAEAYRDAVGVWTIGYGTTAMAGVGIVPVPGMVISEADATFYLMKGLEKFADEIRPAISREANENQFGAMLSLAYNIGPTAFKRSTLLRKFNAGDIQGAAAQFDVWNKAGGKVLRGLVNRRADEKRLFLTPVKAAQPTHWLQSIINAILRMFK